MQKLQFVKCVQKPKLSLLYWNKQPTDSAYKYVSKGKMVNATLMLATRWFSIFLILNILKSALNFLKLVHITKLPTSINNTLEFFTGE
tara:strand:+ start:308 stop:571 length:264 start_codon:yes stop_codon:yes gene_type:complete